MSLDESLDEVPALEEIPPEAGADRLPRHILRELGFGVREAGEELRGRGTITDLMHVPGAGRLRTSVLAVWSDVLTGLLAGVSMGGRVPVTLGLDVHLHRPAPAAGEIVGVARAVKNGRSVFVAEAEFSVDGGEPFAVSTASFMMAPDPSLRLPENLSIGEGPPRDLLSVPLAERAGCERREPGVAVLPRSEDGLNSSNTVNGGLIALAAEEAALSLGRGGETLSSLVLHYLQPVRVGPLVAVAEVNGSLGRVELRDAGAEDRLAGLAATRTFS